MRIHKKILALPIPPCELGERAAYKSALHEASILAEAYFKEQEEKWQQTHTRKIIEHELVFNEKYSLLQDELADLKECHNNLLQSDKSVIEQMIAEIRSDYYTDETSMVLQKYEGMNHG